MIMARELTRGFDSIGRQFDKHGQYSDWNWAAGPYNALARCIVEQYSEYQVEGQNVSIGGSD